MVFFFLKETFINFIKHGVLVAVLSESNHFMVVRWFLTITQDNKNTILLDIYPSLHDSNFLKAKSLETVKGPKESVVESLVSRSPVKALMTESHYHPRGL